ncbi:hypothetical protein JCM5350_000751 [Sporobolomyces pararoseus]
MPRRLPPSPLKLIPQTPGNPPPQWPVFVIPCLPPPTFSQPVRVGNRKSSLGGSGVVVGELPGLGEVDIIRAAGNAEV